MNTKKVLFVEPMGAYSNVFARFMTIPLLGPAYLATIAKKAGYEVSVLNENILGRKLKDHEIEADVLCITCITTTIERGKEIARQYKSINPDGKTVIGGIHASMIPQDVAPYFDQVVVGEGENIILDILSGKIKDKIVYADTPKKLDGVPIPDFKLIKDWEKIRIWPVMTSRGCPYDCNFCSVTQMFGRNYRMQSPARVMQEITKYRNGIIFFTDDHFVANMQRTNQLLDAMLESGFNRPWTAQVRTDITKNPELVSKMKEAGCSTVYVGLESVNPKSLVEMNKNQTVEDIKRSIRVFHDNGIRMHGMFIFGHDSDTKDVFKTTSDFSHENEIDYVQYSILTPLPGTRTYFQFEKQGRLLHKKWDFYDGLHAVYKPMQMTADELQRKTIECFSEFYSYTNAVNDAISALSEFATAAVEKMYTKAHFPSMGPAFMKFKGKAILNQWLKYNRPYLEYLRRLSELKQKYAI